jgi:hypothetical protein
MPAAATRWPARDAIGYSRPDLRRHRGSRKLTMSFIRLTATLAAGLGLLTAATAETIDSADGRFAIEAPNAPQIVYSWIDGAANRSWTVSYNGEAKPTVTGSDRDKRYDAAMRAVIERRKGTLLQMKRLEAGPMTGWEFLARIPFANGNGVLRERMFLTDNRFYQIFYTGPSGSETSADVEAFFASFKLKD